MSRRKDDRKLNRKERVLHTRVPEVLERELKQLSESLRIPMSNVIRAALEDALQITEAAGSNAQRRVEELTERLPWIQRVYRQRVGESEPAAGETPKAAENETKRESRRERKAHATRARMLKHLIGFQPLILAKPGECSACQAEIEAGQKAWLGVPEKRGSNVIFCASCAPDVETRPKEETTT